MPFSGRQLLAGWAVGFSLGAFAFGAEVYRPTNSQPIGEPLSPREAVGRLHAPPGFKITLAASEPDVQQPIAIAYDDRGRLWVAECYSYAGSNFTDEKRDRILIFEDTDGDGIFDSRKVFHDHLNRLTGLAIGFGGVWVTTAPTLSFIPDRNGDDTPDGEPVVLLDGWTMDAEHNTVNGLSWGPDGWLYGRHGIKNSSLVGAPGAPASGRAVVSCGIWRFHPTRRVFEVVADGTINPWGLDFDDYGQGFASTSVVDHFWHVVPGARWERWKDRGGHPDPYSYELMSPASDHLHWSGGMWDKNGRIAGTNDQLGGGHSHSDAMIYLGDRWPQEFRGTVLMSNIHGRRINRDAISRRADTGSYVATHRPDFLTVDDPWFRAISLQYGPDGDVMMTDWADFGECHDRDGVHRASGRIYKISWGDPRKVDVDLGRESDAALVALQLHRNDWFVRHARRLLQERAAIGANMTAVHAALLRIFEENSEVTRKLRALWALHVTGGADPVWLSERLTHPDEHIRHWAVRFLMEQEDGLKQAEPLARLAAEESSWLVRLALSSALQRLAPGSRSGLARALIERSSAEIDPNLARMIWYGLQPEIALNPAVNGPVGLDSRVPLLRRFTARRLAAAMAKDATAGETLFAGLKSAKDQDAVTDLLTGTLEGLKGAGRVPAPDGAQERLRQLMRTGEPDVRRSANLLAATLGDSEAIEALRREINDPRGVAALRKESLRKLTEIRPSWLLDDLLGLLRTGQIAESVLQALSAYGDRRVPDAIFAAVSVLKPAEMIVAIETLASRADFARKLLDQISLGKIDRKAISPSQARQISRLGDPALTAQLDKVWGAVGRSAAGTATTITRLKHQLAPAVLAEANLTNGAALFEQRCAACHRLFGQGQNIGPDLTGSGRKDLDYLLLNIIDPNASVPADYRITVITLHDGRVLTGSILSETAEVVTLQLSNAETKLNRAEVKTVERLPMSLMPAGLLESMTATELRDFIGYLMSDPSPSGGQTP